VDGAAGVILTVEPKAPHLGYKVTLPDNNSVLQKNLVFLKMLARCLDTTCIVVSKTMVL
jgi:hypothetical protein